MQGATGERLCWYPLAHWLHVSPMTPSLQAHCPVVWLQVLPEAPTGWQSHSTNNKWWCFTHIQQQTHSGSIAIRSFFLSCLTNCALFGLICKADSNRKRSRSNRNPRRIIWTPFLAYTAWLVWLWLTICGSLCADVACIVLVQWKTTKSTVTGWEQFFNVLYCLTHIYLCYFWRPTFCCG